MYTASGSLRLHLKSHLSRLAANAFSSINLPGFNMNSNNSMNLASMAADPLQLGQNDFKFGIKQELVENSDNIEAADDKANNDNHHSGNFNSETNINHQSEDEN